MCEALLARVYMYKRDYSNAALWSAKVLARDIYALESDLYKVFPPNPNGDVISFSREHLFGFPVSSNGGNWQFGGNEIYYVYNNFWYSYTFISTFADSDERKIKLMREEKNKGVTIYVTDKYPNSNGRDNVTLMRLPEMILTRAEALARTGSVISQEMIDGLNAVHMRANPTSEVFTIDDFSSMDDLIDRILLESSKELAFEGIQRFDQLRSDRPLYNPELPDNKKVLPIPLREITISNGIVRQNEGYVSK